MKHLIILIFLCFTTTALLAQPVNITGMEDEAPKRGKCYSQVQYPAKIKTVEKTYIIYTGRDLKNEHVVEKEITLEPEYIYWKKSRKGKYQIYKNRRTFEVLYIVTDTIAEKNFKLETIEQEQIVQKSYKSDIHHRLICPDEVDQEFLSRLSQALQLEGYSVGNPTEYGGSIEVALTEYQLKNNLPPGTLNIRTLAALGVEDLEDWSIYDDEEEE